MPPNAWGLWNERLWHIVIGMALVGVGYDSHRFTPGRPLVLGGVTIEHSQGLAGHSDADALLHAIIDAILGAAGMGDIGEQFPDCDEAHRGADSAKLLEQVLQWVARRGLRVANCDATVITQEPKLSPYKMAMRQRIALLLGLEIQYVNVKAKTNEGMGWIGRGEGLAAMAAVMLEPARPLGPPPTMPGLAYGSAAGAMGGLLEEQADLVSAVEPPPLPPGVAAMDPEGPGLEDLRNAAATDAAEMQSGRGQHCPNCGKQVTGDDVHCPRCGTDLTEPRKSGLGCLGAAIIVGLLLIITATIVAHFAR